MIVQDDVRERKLIELFGLVSGDGNRIGVDAFDTFGNPFELKTTSKKSVSTARDLGIDHLDKWSKRYWIIATFDAATSDFERFFFLAPEHMRGWYDKIRARLKRDHDLSALALNDSRLPPDAKKRLAYLLHRGALLNDPNIPWAYVESHGIEINCNHKGQLQALVGLYPLEVGQAIDPLDSLICFG
jgi:hypothetical protein